MLGIVLALAVAACGGAPDGTDTALVEVPRVVTTYTVRGQVVSLPTAPGEDIQLAHEAIHDLKDADGHVLGMDAMTMYFGVDSDLDLSELAVGDIVEFDLAVDWQADETAVITRVSKLPPETELVFGKAEVDDSAP